MHNKIHKDKKRFEDILKQKVKKDFKWYIVRKDWIIPKGKDKYTLPIHTIRIPRFTYGQNEKGGIGQGNGEEGQELDKNAEHKPEIEATLEELAEMLSESLQLPRLEKKEKNQMSTIAQKYKTTSTTPKTLVHFKKTYLQALKRTIIEGTYNPETPLQINEQDLIYKAPKKTELPDTKAVIFYMMDVSGSMDDEKKELVRTTAFWIDTYLRSQYKHLDNRYIIHDTAAEEVNKDLFYIVNTDGGTQISSAIELSDKIIEKEYPASDWNIYLFQFSDGENMPREDNKQAETRIKKMLQYINQYAYAEVGDKGNFKEYISQKFKNEPKIALASINNKLGIISTLQQFLSQGN